VCIAVAPYLNSWRRRRPWPGQRHGRAAASRQLDCPPSPPLQPPSTLSTPLPPPTTLAPPLPPLPLLLEAPVRLPFPIPPGNGGGGHRAATGTAVPSPPDISRAGASTGPVTWPPCPPFLARRSPSGASAAVTTAAAAAAAAAATAAPVAAAAVSGFSTSVTAHHASPARLATVGAANLRQAARQSPPRPTPWGRKKITHRRQRLAAPPLRRGDRRAAADTAAPAAVAAPVAAAVVTGASVGTDRDADLRLEIAILSLIIDQYEPLVHVSGWVCPREKGRRARGSEGSDGRREWGRLEGGRIGGGTTDAGGTSAERERRDTEATGFSAGGGGFSPVCGLAVGEGHSSPAGDGERWGSTSCFRKGQRERGRL